MSTVSLPMFKVWVPEWLIRLTIFLVLLPALAIFALYFSNVNETAGYYGITPADVQYSVVIMYATLATFLPMDDRLIRFLKPRQYILLGAAVNTLTYILCATTRDASVFMVCRFFQGMVCAMFCSICLNLIFPRLHSNRARVVGYSVFYGTLQMSIPFGAIFCNWILHYFDFNAIFYFLICFEAPGIFLLLVTTNNVRFRKKFPLYQTEWVSFIFYTLFFCCLGYVLIYGQRLNWLYSPQIRILLLAAILCCGIFFARQYALKRPFVNLRLLNFGNFRNGLLLLIAYYVFKGTTGFTYAYLQGGLNIDPVHLTPILLINIAGIVIGVIVSSRFILFGTPLKRIIICGFSCFLVFHWMMYFLLSSEAETNQFLLPLLVHGLGTGALFVPIVMFLVSSVPPSMTGSVSFLGIASRFCGFCITFAIANYFQLYNRSEHFNKFREQITAINPMREFVAAQYVEHFRQSGQDEETAHELASHVFSKAVGEQVALRSTMDYYQLMIEGLIVLLLVLIVVPSAKRVIVRYSKRFIPY